MSTTLDAPKEYLKLIRRFPLLPITSEAKLEAAIEAMKELTRPDKKLTNSESGYLKILTGLIREYESKQYPQSTTSPQEIVEALIEEAGLNQTAFAIELGIERSNLSAFLSHNRQLSKTNALKIAQRFKIDVTALL